MDRVMLTHLSQIIGKEGILTSEVQQEQGSVLFSIIRRFEEAKAKLLERPISMDECKQALLVWALRKPQGKMGWSPSS